MTNPIARIPELRALETQPSLIRIPGQIDVPVTPRVIRLIDSASFQRLSGVSQLGLVSLVYPGATHSRFEHSLGVYRNALLFVRQLSQFDQFRETVTDQQVMAVLVAALLHDIGHWPFCHPIEDLGLDGIPPHEQLAADQIIGGQLADLLDDQWDIDPQIVIDLIRRQNETVAERLLGSILSGPIDVDKMDYLYRDSLHCGVPYGMNFDAQRLIRSLCLNESGDGIALTSKGKTAAEMMVFARYVMFSEVYWHHAVRSATAMFQRAFFNWYSHIDGDKKQIVGSLGRTELISRLRSIRRNDVHLDLVEGLFGLKRSLYKRLASFNFAEKPLIYQRLAQQPYQTLLDCEKRLSENLSKVLKTDVRDDEIIIDAPPVGLEVQFQVGLFDANTGQYRAMKDVSPVVQALATRQFDDFVKQVRVFIHPRLFDESLRQKINGREFERLLTSAIS